MSDYKLLDSTRTTRFAAIKEVGEAIAKGDILPRSEKCSEVNNHVHTSFSFSPYSPSLAALRAWEAGLDVVGCIDHDSMGGAKEMLAAGQAFGIAVTVGFEARCSLEGTPFMGRKLNSPDSDSFAYFVMHGVAARRIDEVQEFLAPYRAARNERNKRMIAKLNTLIAKEMQLSFADDVYPISEAKDGGTITERHILFALAHKIDSYARKQGMRASEVFAQVLKVELNAKQTQAIDDMDSPHRLYDMLGICKVQFLPRFFEQPSDELPSVPAFIALARKLGAIPCYAYLGDVVVPSDDKPSEHFEDAYLPELLDWLKEAGFEAISYMPPRNTREQLMGLQELCKERELLQISGVDINSSRQSFNCPILQDPLFSSLIDATWALYAHETALEVGGDEWGFFGSKMASYSREERLERYAAWGRAIDVQKPYESIKALLDAKN